MPVTYQPPLLSIVTVVLNNREGFARTARSVAAQEGAHYEWLVIDGGSVDGTLNHSKLCRTYIDYWISEPDRGLYDAMNKGIQIANGEYLLFLNSSDYFYRPQSLRSVQEILKSDHDLDILLGGAIRRTSSP